MKFVQQITAWSPSRLFQYEECPFKAKQKFILRKKEPDSPAAARGSMIDGAARSFIETTREPTLIAELRPVSKFLKQFRILGQKKKAKCNVEITFRRDWSVTRWDDWKEAWLRVKLDLLLFPKKDAAEVVDVKSGKLRLENGSNYEAQVRIYNMSVLAAGFAKESIAGLLFTDHGVLHRPKKNAVLKLAQLPKEKKYWEERVAPMFNDKLFPPRPGNYCRWCFFSKAKGGPCKF